MWIKLIMVNDKPYKAVTGDVELAIKLFQERLWREQKMPLCNRKSFEARQTWSVKPIRLQNFPEESS